jgi:hypothetical protein
MCLIKEALSLPVLFVVPIPELHILMGFVNKMARFIRKKWDKGFDLWVYGLGCVRKGYHSGDYEGGACRDILKNCDKLEHVLPQDLKPLVVTFQKFDKVVAGTFGFTLDPNYREIIAVFKESFKNAQEYCASVLGAELTVNWKIHCVTAHLEEFISRTGHSLGRYNEQCIEASHAALKPLVRNYGLSVRHENSGIKSRRICETFSSQNI